MKKLFIETNGYNMVAFFDGTKVYVIEDTCFDDVLTLDAAKSADYSNFDGCETAEECAIAMGKNTNNDGEYDNVYAYADVVSFTDNVVEF